MRRSVIFIAVRISSQANIGKCSLIKAFNQISRQFWDNISANYIFLQVERQNKMTPYKFPRDAGEELEKDRSRSKV